MNKGQKKSGSYLLMALFVASTVLPVVSSHYETVKWLATMAACATCLWRARDYWTKGEYEDTADQLVGKEEAAQDPKTVR